MKFQTLFLTGWLVNKNGTKRDESFILYVMYDWFFFCKLQTDTFTMHIHCKSQNPTFSVLDKGVLRKKRLSRIKRKCTEKSRKRQKLRPWWKMTPILIFNSCEVFGVSLSKYGGVFKFASMFLRKKWSLCHREERN